jgi:hypothetical protein
MYIFIKLLIIIVIIASLYLSMIDEIYWLLLAIIGILGFIAISKK